MFETQNKNGKVTETTIYSTSTIPHTSYTLTVSENIHIDGYVTYSAILKHDNTVKTENKYSLLRDAYSMCRMWDSMYSTI